jgi:beta-aspartyl-peptidase (threonine type)
MAVKPVIIMHGGARVPANGKYQEALKLCSKRGMEVLRLGGSSLDAVEAAIVMAEDSGVFNAGSGSHLNLAGEMEMDAAIMEGGNLHSGAVAAIPRVKNPIRVARKVMDDTDHVLMAGQGAYRFARAAGLDEEVTRNPKRVEEWDKLRQELTKSGKLTGINLPDPEKLKKWLIHEESTVGAVAIDAQRKVAVAISSGGTPMKLPGRVGDVPLLGCSFFANNQIGGVSLTGTGNIMIKRATARWIVQLMTQGISVQKAVECVVDILNRQYDPMVLGVVALDVAGNFGAARNLEGMPHCYQAIDMDEPMEKFAPILKR